MKKNIDYINVDSQLLKWIKNSLEHNKDKYESKDELKTSISNLIDGISESLIIENKDTGENSYNKDKITCGNLIIYSNFRRVTRDGEEIILTPKEFDILYFLAKNRGQVFTKEQIYKAVWEDNYLLDDSNIMAFIRKLRKKIEPNPDSPIYIITIWGIGYKFNDKL